jgi:hypothetical protein
MILSGGILFPFRYDQAMPARHLTKYSKFNFCFNEHIIHCGQSAAVFNVKGSTYSHQGAGGTWA